MTFCTDRRRAVLAARRSGRMELSPVGQIVAALWLGLPDRFSGVTLDEFVVMPDHVHVVIHINEGSCAELRKVVQGLKGLATIEARRAGVWGTQALWQRSFHDRVIRDQRELDRIRIYIRENPQKG